MQLSNAGWLCSGAFRLKAFFLNTMFFETQMIHPPVALICQGSKNACSALREAPFSDRRIIREVLSNDKFAIACLRGKSSKVMSHSFI